MSARTTIKVGLASAFGSSGLLPLMSHLRARAFRPRVHVLAYHRVVDELPGDGLINPALCITARSFEQQMRQVRDRFRVLTLEEALRAVAGQLPLNRDAVTITFDDGYRDVRARALPILHALGLPATVFVCTGYLDGGYLPHDRLHAALWAAQQQHLMLLREAPDALVEQLIRTLPSRALLQLATSLERLVGGAPALGGGARCLSAVEIRALSKAGWEIGAHTVEHAVLTHEPDRRVAEQLSRPRRDLERITGKPCRYFAYCNGYHSPRIVRAVRAAGYLGAVTTRDRPNRAGDDPFRLGRKCLWEGHARGADGNFCAALSAAHLHDLFGDLGLTRPVDGEVAHDFAPEVLSCAT